MNSQAAPEAVQGAVARLSAKQARPLFIVCPGPSALALDPGLLPKEAVIARMNLFFFEDEPRWGRAIDAYFWASESAVLYQGLSDRLEAGDYSVDAFFSPSRFQAQGDPSNRQGRRAQRLFAPLGDHWAVIARNPLLAQGMMRRPLPTQAFQVLACCVELGFRDIHLIGVDLYTDTHRRYGHTFPADIAQRLGSAHTNPGYEPHEHSMAADLAFLEMIQAAYPDIRITNASPNSPLSSILPASPMLTHDWSQPEAPRAEPRPRPDQVASSLTTALEAEVATLRSALLRLETSWSLRLGRWVLKPLHGAKRALTVMRRWGGGVVRRF